MTTTHPIAHTADDYKQLPNGSIVAAPKQSTVYIQISTDRWIAPNLPGLNITSEDLAGTPRRVLRTGLI